MLGISPTKRQCYFNFERGTYKKLLIGHQGQDQGNSDHGQCVNPGLKLQNAQTSVLQQINRLNQPLERMRKPACISTTI